jgi:hypothetical protein
VNGVVGGSSRQVKLVGQIVQPVVDGGLEAISVCAVKLNQGSRTQARNSAAWQQKIREQRKSPMEATALRCADHKPAKNIKNRTNKKSAIIPAKNSAIHQATERTPFAYLREWVRHLSVMFKVLLIGSTRRKVLLNFRLIAYF